jgi:hypothetical protein
MKTYDLQTLAFSYICTLLRKSINTLRTEIIGLIYILSR